MLVRKKLRTFSTLKIKWNMKVKAARKRTQVLGEKMKQATKSLNFQEDDTS